MDNRLKAFLDRARVDQIVPVGVQDYIDSDEIYRRFAPHLETAQARRDLNSALASLLGSDRQQWDEVLALADRFLIDEGPDQSEVAEIPLDHAKPVYTSAPSIRQLLAHWFLELPRWRIAVGAAVLLAGIIALGLFLLTPDPPAKPVAVKEEVPGPKPFTGPQPNWAKVPMGRSPVVVSITTPRGTPVPLPWPLVAGSGILIVLGGCWLALPGRLRREGNAKARQLAQDALATRRVLSRSAEESGASRRLTYHVPRVPPMREDAAADAATILSRTYGNASITEIDADRTVDATIGAGGRFTPVAARRIASRSLTILVDLESQAHPWLNDVEWLLERWAAMGVRYERYNFKLDPSFLTTAKEGLPRSLAALGRRADGEPLLVISRKLMTHGYKRDANWLAQSGCWPIRAWLDPSPLAAREMPRAYLAEISKLRHRGFQRFSLSEAGLVSLANYLATNGIGVKPATVAALPALADPDVARAVEKWALFSALVPDPTWDQLQAIREAIPELREVLPDNRYLQRLLDWARMNSKDGTAESGDGLTLELEPETVEALIIKHRKAEARTPVKDRFETRCRELILNQLGGTPPTSELMHQFWKLKRAQHQLAINPSEGLAAMCELAAGPWRNEVLESLIAELERDKAAPMLPRSVRDAAWLETGNRSVIVPWDALVRPGREPLYSALIGAAFLAAFAVAIIDEGYQTPHRLSGQLPLFSSAPNPGAKTAQSGDFSLEPSKNRNRQQTIEQRRIPATTVDLPVPVSSWSCGVPYTITDPLWAAPAGEPRPDNSDTSDLDSFNVDEDANPSGVMVLSNTSDGLMPDNDAVFNTVLLDSRGRILWNGVQIDGEKLQQYTEITTTMSPKPVLKLIINRAASCSDGLRMLHAIQLSRVCGRGPCQLSWTGSPPTIMPTRSPARPN